MKRDLTVKQASVLVKNLCIKGEYFSIEDTISGFQEDRVMDPNEKRVYVDSVGHTKKRPTLRAAVDEMKEMLEKFRRNTSST